MPYRVTCHVAGLSGYESTAGQLPIDDLPEFFLEASHGAIELEFDRSRADKIAHIEGENANALTLHEANAILTQNPQTPGQVHDIALIVAGQYLRLPASYGLMFDRGHQTADDPIGGDVAYSVAREGCAVFTDVIARDLPDTELAAIEQRFTVAHELGHVFNLVHRGDSSLMRGSTLGQPLPSFDFVDDERDWLALCESDQRVWPGGEEFRDYDSQLISALRRKRAPAPVELTIRLSRSVAAPWDPVELDLVVRLGGGRTKPVEVPDAFDPGYSSFAIWIDEPNGERRRLRSAIHHCPHRASCTIGPRSPFRRDITLSREAGRRTFRRPGEHRIWIECTLPHGAVARSNEVVLDVTYGGSANAARILCDPVVRRVVLFRDADRSIADLRHVQRAARELGQDRARGMVAYSLGRAAARMAGRVRRKSVRDWVKQTARTALRFALEAPAVSRHARRTASETLESL